MTATRRPRAVAAALALLLAMPVAASAAAAQPFYQHYEQGLALAERGEWAAALAELAAAAELEPRPRERIRTYGNRYLFDYDPHFHQARCLVELGRWGEAREQLAESRAGGVTAAAEIDGLGRRAAAAERASRERAATPAPERPEAPAAGASGETGRRGADREGAGPAGEAPQSARLAVITRPPGAEVSLDGRRLGRTPLAPVRVTAGRHRVRLAAEGFAAWEQTVEAAAGETLRLDVTLRPPASAAEPGEGVGGGSGTAADRRAVGRQPPPLAGETAGATSAGGGARGGGAPGDGTVREGVVGGSEEVGAATAGASGGSGAQPEPDSIRRGAGGETLPAGEEPGEGSGAGSGPGSGSGETGGEDGTLGARGEAAPAAPAAGEEAGQRAGGGAGPAVPAAEAAAARSAVPFAALGAVAAALALAAIPVAVLLGRRRRAHGLAGSASGALAGGRRIGGYRVAGELGRGGMAITYRARRRSDGLEVALKVPRDSPDPTYLARFLREGKLGETLHHPGIVRIFEAAEDHGVPFLAMELIPGRTLRAELDAAPGGLDERRALEIARAIAEALDYAHGKSVVHRDLKPENIMLLPGGGLKVMDFGVARVDGQPGLTTSQVFFGSPLYAAPELVEPRTIDHRADLYSLGILLYEMLEGAPPFVHVSVFKLLEMHQRSRLPDPAALPRPLPPALWAVVARLCEKRPDRRYGSAQELLVDLDRLLFTEPARVRDAPASMG